MYFGALFDEFSGGTESAKKIGPFVKNGVIAGGYDGTIISSNIK